MPNSFRALCTDFYVNQKMNVRLDLPRSRDTVLDLFERLRRSYPDLKTFKRYNEELALEGARETSPHRWVAVRTNSVRAGVVNPQGDEDAYGLHHALLETAPYYLSISPLDIEYVELLYGFDLAANGNHDAIVAEALMGGSPLASLFDVPGASTMEFQPLIGLSLNVSDGVEAHFEVKTRSGPGAYSGGEPREEPISVYLTVRHYDPVSELSQLPDRLEHLARAGHELVEDRVLPSLLAPLRQAIGSGNL